MDQDAAALKDAELFDPDFQQRNYSEVAAQLPVFCVSSKAYQKMCGRLEQDESVSGFPSLEDTEIPGLRKHAQDIVRETRVATLHMFFNLLSQFLTSIKMQVVVSTQPLNLQEDLREQELKFLKDSVRKLRRVCVGHPNGPSELLLTALWVGC